MKITVKPPGGPVLFERTLEAREVVRGKLIVDGEELPGGPNAEGVERVARSGILDRLLAALLGWRVHTCRPCGRRFYDRPESPSDAQAPVIAGSVTNLGRGPAQRMQLAVERLGPDGAVVGTSACLN